MTWNEENKEWEVDEYTLEESSRKREQRTLTKWALANTPKNDGKVIFVDFRNRKVLAENREEIITTTASKTKKKLMKKRSVLKGGGDAA